jgi:ribonuclease P protein component
MKTSIKSLKNDELFRLINKHGKKVFTSNFIIVFCSKNILPIPYLNSTSEGALIKPYDIEGSEYFHDHCCYYGIKASKKIGNAVLRNKVKRRLKHAIRNLNNQDACFHQRSFIVIPKAKCATMSFEKLQKELQHSITQ